MKAEFPANNDHKLKMCGLIRQLLAANDKSGRESEVFGI
jgi:hypothetical protein